VVGEIGLNEPKSRRNMEANLKAGRLGRECAQVFVCKGREGTNSNEQYDEG
jgi:hypothetical protein